MTQAEVEGQCGLKPPMRGRPPPPRSRQRPTPRSIEYALLEIVASRPAWAARLPLDHIDPEKDEGAALLAIANAVEHGEMPAGGFGLVIEFFRGTPHERVLESLAASLAGDESDATALDAVFSDAIGRLGRAAVEREIAALTAAAQHGLTSEERLRLTRLLQAKREAGLAEGGTLL
jgi:DNA primase